jgi:cytochrome c biogenesis protein CcmG/thiol:disulfide interchange protein DsbE
MSSKRARKDRERLRAEREARERAGEGSARRRRLVLGGSAAGLVVIGLAVAAIVSGGSGPGPSGATVASEAPGGAHGTESGTGKKGADRSAGGALAANRAQANQLIDGGEEALDAKLAELRGHPVVVNQWGSWCPPCRAEFPFFGESAAAHEGEIAFVGVDIQDDRDAAEDFLAELPVPYPSVFDPDAEAVFSLGWGQSSPTTWFIDGGGEIVHQRPGAYVDRAELEADIEAFLLSG